jgi:hypothetical protein
MADEIIKIIDKNRETSSSYHLRLAREWRLYGGHKQLHNPLAYSAFEFRMAIERFLFEFYYLLNKREGFGDKEAKKASSLKNLIKAICLKVDNKEILMKRLKFNRIVAENQIVNGSYLRGPNLPSVFDIDLLYNYWQKLSNYCHKQLKPESTWESFGNGWVNKGYELLNEVEDYLFNIMVKNSMGWFNFDDNQDEMKTAQAEYISGKIDDDALNIRIRIMTPILEMRKKSK